MNWSGYRFIGNQPLLVHTILSLFVFGVMKVKMRRNLWFSSKVYGVVDIMDPLQ